MRGIFDFCTMVASAGERRDGRSPRFVHLTASIFAWQFIVVVHAVRKEGYMKTFVATIIGFLFACNSMVTCSAASITDLKAAIEGVYILDEWNIDGQTFRPPLVEGRFVVLNGNIMTVLIDATQEAKKKLIARGMVYTCSLPTLLLINTRLTRFSLKPRIISLCPALYRGRACVSSR